MNSKYQTTIFVVLGIVILASVAIGYYLMSSSQISAAESERSLIAASF